MNAIAEDPTLWIDVGAVTDVPLRGARRVPTPKGDVAVFRTGDNQLYALLDRCPHKDGPLSQGIVHGHAVACPLHNWSIGLDDGCAKAPDEGCTPRFAVKVVEEVVHLDANELATHAIDLPRPVAGPARHIALSPLPLGEG